MTRILFASALALTVLTWGQPDLSFQSSTPARLAGGSVPVFDHIFVIVMENQASSRIIDNTQQAPYFNQLASQYGLATNYLAVAHPSLPNYLALTGGDTFGITSDCTTCFVDAPNLAVDRIAPSGRSWKAYMEGIPTACLVGDAYPYLQKHDPFVYYNDLRLSAECGSHVVSLDQLTNDLASVETTPSYGWITPNACHDMHDCSIATGDRWLQSTVPQLLGSSAFTSQNSLLLITWDENDASQENHVATLVIAASISPGFRSPVAYTHYSLLRTIERAWDLAPLGANDANANAMTDFFVSDGSLGLNLEAAARNGLVAEYGHRQLKGELLRSIGRARDRG
jgi:hypothetical protein